MEPPISHRCAPRVTHHIDLLSMVLSEYGYEFGEHNTKAFHPIPEKAEGFYAADEPESCGIQSLRITNGLRRGVKRRGGGGGQHFRSALHWSHHH